MRTLEERLEERKAHRERNARQRTAYRAKQKVKRAEARAAAPVVEEQHAPGLATVLAADDDDLVVATDLDSHGSYNTSGASETIFMKLRSRSSRATGPKMRVPRGLFCASMITAAFSSKAM